MDKLDKPDVTGTARYGDFYWCVKVPKTISDDGDIYVMADSIEVHQDGSLWCIGHSVKDESKKQPVLVLAAGSWLVTYAASLLDGAAIAVEHWSGEVSR